MTLHMLAWLVWFFAATWTENVAILCKRWFAKGLHAMRKFGSAAFEGSRGTSTRTDRATGPRQSGRWVIRKSASSDIRPGSDR